MDGPGRGHRLEQLAFAAGRAAAAHIQPGGRAVRAEQQHGAAGGGFGVLRVADGDAGQGGEWDFPV